MQIQLKVKKAKIQRTFELEQCMYVTEKHLLTNRAQQVLRFSTRMFVKIHSSSSSSSVPVLPPKADFFWRHFLRSVRGIYIDCRS